MSLLEDGVLLAHILAGAIAILAGVVALGTKKGGRRHRRAGRVFVWMMAVVVVSTLGLAVVDPTPFRLILTLVAIFSGYFAFSGYRVLSRKRPAETPASVDWSALGALVIACAALGAWGLSWLVDGRDFGVVMLVFGGIGITLGVGDIQDFRQGNTTPWLVTHLQRMLAAFIATVSAVSAVNLTPALGIAAWLWPTAVGVPLIAYWSRKYE